MVSSLGDRAQRARGYLRAHVAFSLFFGLIAPASTRAQGISLREALLVDEGFRVFTEETFQGNGRKCSTCHIPEANYSISPIEIEGLNREDRAL